MQHTETDRIVKRKMRGLEPKYRRALKKCAVHTGGGFGVLAGTKADMALAKVAIAQIMDNLTPAEERAVAREMAASMWDQFGVGVSA